MSKQDRQGVRTATDLERKYGFGQSFAEVYNLIDDAQQTANEAKDAANNVSENMTTKQIFNMLTRFGLEQGVFRAVDGKLYINAECLYGTILDGQELTVDAATINGTMSSVNIEGGQISGTEVLVRESFEYPAVLTGKSAIHIVPIGMDSPVGSIYYNRNPNSALDQSLSLHNLWITTQKEINGSIGASIKIDAGHRLSLEGKKLVYIESKDESVKFAGNVDFSGCTLDFNGAALNNLSATAVFG